MANHSNFFPNASFMSGFNGSVAAARIAALISIIVTVVALAGPAPLAHAAMQPFSPGSPFRTPIPDGAAIDPKSDVMVAHLSSDGAMSANLVAYGIPIYQADPSTPSHSVGCTEDWGRCPFEGVQVPIPAGARPSSGSDAAMVVVDASSGQIFELWRARQSGGGWTAGWGSITNLNGSGWGGGATGSGASRLGGVIQVAEIQEGVIPHALAVATNNVCAGTFRPPATSTDGKSNRANCIPEGARIRLDPGVDLDALDLPPGVRAVARAMQVYGAYVVDVSGAALNVAFEVDPSGNGIGATYRQAGFTGDYDPMSGVPWNRLQVLA
ncbi:hypothetical protein C6A87_018535 [Mycobacterium sp. ITM-2016-00317]|uniref:hypothetical protein n=1 Tax=Mycobacterium sp. ITM-2016-00317 TaxID=2099694 RepID=UPI00287F9723|nr:hypothetical protein [Mycobacterium sp. ITM-2016-00317]WNG85909.1 hypothetical protein C6A87_018535 [Mycobacterium sp. ITM-2016-00317]